MKRTERAEVIAGDLEIYAGRHRADLIRNVDPDTGGPVQHLRVRDQWPLDRMQASGAIDAEQYEAGRRFRDAFDRASFHGIKALDPGKPFVQASAVERLPADAVAGARESVNRSLRAVGIVGGDALWYIVGQGDSVAAWVGRRRAAGIPMNQDRALGILTAALSTLAAHYGIGKR